jgi:hypothetical protein
MASFPPGRQRSAIASTVESSSPSGEGLDLEPKPDAACCPLCNRSHSDRARPDVTRVLVVEDDDAIANLIACNLERSGHYVTVVSDAPRRCAGSVSPPPTSWSSIYCFRYGADGKCSVRCDPRWGASPRFPCCW